MVGSAARAELNHRSHFFLPDSREHIGIEVRERDVIVEITLNLLRFILRCQSFNINNNLLVTYFTAKQGTPGCAETADLKKSKDRKTWQSGDSP